MVNQTKDIAKNTRAYRKIHQWLSVPLFLFMFLIGFTGLLLGWKKQVSLLPPTQKGSTSMATTWLSLDSLLQIATTYVGDSLQKSTVIDRIDVRPKKGIAKFRFEQHYTELQLDCQTGEVLSVAFRGSDLIEQIHDGSILDQWLGLSASPVKLMYTTAASAGLMLLSFSGFWLWYNPRRIKKMKGANALN